MMHVYEQQVYMVEMWTLNVDDMQRLERNDVTKLCWTYECTCSTV